jgi:aldose 1-epimerase
MRLQICLALLAALATEPAMADITKAPWGTTAKGEAADIYTLTGAGGLKVRISTFGAVVVNLMAPGRDGTYADVVLGFDNLAAYEKGGVQNAVIGRFVNRVSGGGFTLEGHRYELEHGPNQTVIGHSGAYGFQKRIWTATPHDGAEPSLALRISSPDGEGGWPGNVTATVTYTVTRDNALRVTFDAVTDRPTVMNLTNHTYFNLAGDASGTVLDQTLEVFADQYTVQSANGVPTGAFAPVKGTPLDFNTPVRLGDVVDSPFPPIAERKGLDINLVVRGKPGTLRPAARMRDPASGRTLDVSTTQPGVQLYSDNVNAPTAGKNGASYPPRASLSLETQHYPDSPNRPEFPSTEVTPDRPLHEVTVFKFSVS